MKKAFIVLSLLLAYISSWAQEWGIRAGFDINLPSKLGGTFDGKKIDMFKMGYGGTLGVVYKHWFNDYIFLEPGASIFYDSYAYKDIMVDNGPFSLEELDASIYKVGVRIPLVVGYSYYLLDDLPMRVYTGPELSYAFAGGTHVKNKSLKDDFDLKPFGRNGYMNHVDCAWKIGIGAEFDIATVCFDVAIGMTDLYKDHLTLRENRVTISVLRYF